MAAATAMTIAQVKAMAVSGIVIVRPGRRILGKESTRISASRWLSIGIRSFVLDLQVQYTAGFLKMQILSSYVLVFLTGITGRGILGT